MDYEAEYNARAAIPDHPALFEAWVQRSAAVRAKCAECLDIRYGEGDREVLDFFPAMTPDAPIAVYLHGGYWQWNDKSGFTFLAESLVRAGFSTALVNYPLAPSATVPAIVESVRDALAFLWKGADRRLRGARDRLYVIGHSAGAHLAVTAMATDWPARDPALPRDLMKGVLAVSGVYDLRPLVQTSMNDALGLDETGARAASPLFMEPKSAGPLMLAVGGLESGEFHRQSRDLGRAWAEKGVRVAELNLANRNHLTVLEDLAAPDGPLLRTLETMAEMPESAVRR